MKAHWSAKLESLGACSEAVEWCKTQKNAASAWTHCKRGDWLLWIVAKTTRVVRGSAEHRQIVRAACAIARTVLKYVPVGEERPRLAIEAAEAWVRNPSAAARAAANSNSADIVRSVIKMPKLGGAK